ncbi:MAG TPA: hypothetical protein VFD05_00275 [Bacilli bacterium]|nr:hypothetical protein [Bacilli bacterium]
MINSFLDFSNEEVYLALASGNEEAFDVLHNRFRNFIKGQIGKILSINKFAAVDYEDLELVANMAFVTAVSTYDVKKSPFASYVTVVIKNALANVVAKQFSPTEAMSNYAGRLDEQVFADNSNLLLSDVLGSQDCYLDASRFSNDSVLHIRDLTRITLTDIEEKVLIAKLKGYNHKEIGEQHKLTKRQLDRIVRTIKEKYLKSNEDK